ncbi:MAG: rRNA adenine N-6-methyltransferase family protein, partial [Halanaerobium sp.]
MENKIATPSKTKKILRKHNLNLKKSLGQNFLVDSNIIEIITAAAAIQGDEFLIEIGPGIGSLTEALLGKIDSGKLLAVEKDAAMVEVLKDIFAAENKLTLLNQDALKINWEEIAA